MKPLSGPYPNASHTKIKARHTVVSRYLWSGVRDGSDAPSLDVMVSRRSAPLWFRHMATSRSTLNLLAVRKQDYLAVDDVDDLPTISPVHQILKHTVAIEVKNIVDDVQRRPVVT